MGKTVRIRRYRKRTRTLPIWLFLKLYEPVQEDGESHDLDRYYNEKVN